MYLMGTGGVVTVKIPCAFSRIEKRGLGEWKRKESRTLHYKAHHRETSFVSIHELVNFIEKRILMVSFK